MATTNICKLVTLAFVATVPTGCSDRAATQDLKGSTPAQSPDPEQSQRPPTQSTTVTTDAPKLTAEQIDFGTKWKDATVEDRRTMADVAKVGTMFQGVSKSSIKTLFGEATQSGVDAFGEDMFRFELGDVPKADGGGKYHLTFVFENGVVVRVMGNFATISP